MFVCCWELYIREVNIDVVGKKRINCFNNVFEKERQDRMYWISGGVGFRQDVINLFFMLERKV